MDFQEVKKIIKDSLTDAHVIVDDLTGTQDHLAITIVSDHFIDLPLLKQHRTIMDLLREKLKSEIHAVQLKTLTFEKAKNLNINIEN